MPSHPIVDSHVHLWDPSVLRYPWLADNPILNRRFGLEDFDRARGELEVNDLVFVQCEADPAQGFEEALWVSDLAQSDPRLAAIVAWAPLEKGAAVREDLERLAALPLLRGIRRIIQFEPDRDFCRRPGFLEGARMLAEFGLTFDICTDWTRLPQVIDFARALPHVRMVVDHIGKPPIADGTFEPWASNLSLLAELPNVSCKISGVATEANHQHWTEASLLPFISHAMEKFGFERVMFGGDWPVASQAIDYRRWVDLLDQVLGLSTKLQQLAFWSGNARRFYRMGN